MAKTIDIQGGYIIPGLCDAHVHVTAVSANLHDLLVLPPSLVTARTTIILRDMLMRGFTTVRDAGGCDWGLAKVRCIYLGNTSVRLQCSSSCLTRWVFHTNASRIEI